MGMGGLASALGRTALVVKEFKINEEGPEYVHIVARKAGFVSWLLSLVGIDSTTTFQLFNNRILFTEGSLSGQMKSCMPLSALSIATSGYFKPFAELVFGIVLSLVGVYMLCDMGSIGLIPLIVGILMIVGYFLSKSLLIEVVSNSSWPASICFKRSVIEGVPVTYETAMKVIEIINRLVMEQTAK